MQATATEQRYRGFGGGIIRKHRAMLTALHKPQRFFTAALTAAGVLLVWAASLDWVVRLWAWLMDWWRQALGMDGQVTMIPYSLGQWFHFQVPHLQFYAGLPDNDLWWGGMIFTAVLVLGSVLLPHRLLPLSFLMRIFAFFQGCAQFFFAVWPDAFPYRGPGYVHGALIAGLGLVTLIPVLLGVTYFTFDFKLRRKLALAFLVMGHLTLMVPLQYLMQSWLMNQLSLLFMPMLFFVLGLPLNVMVFIAFYSWGFSWPDELYRGGSGAAAFREQTP